MNPRKKHELKSVTTDSIAGSIDERIRLLEQENENLKLKLAKSNTEKNNNTDSYFQ
jgi:uncharacterized small protein (DUF1192 family)